jgi:hypothetical protein
MGITKVALGSLVVFGIFSCSKPTQENSASVDSTAATTTNTELPVQAPLKVNGYDPIKLTDAQLERINLEVFLWLHDYQTYGYDPSIIVYKESFTSNRNEFEYEILRHNGSRTGQYTIYNQASNDYDQPLMEPTAPVSDETREANAILDAQKAKEEGEESEEEFYDEGGDYNETDWKSEGYAIGEIDTVNASGSFLAYPEGDPEQKKIRIVFTGSIRWTNYNYIKYGQQKSGLKDYGIPDMVIDLSTPRILAGEQLYLKAKIALLTDEDLAPMSKEGLGVLRNEIFARHGHSFKTDKMKNHFQPLEWYRPVIADATPLLNDFEKRNVEFIKKKEG